MTASAVSSSIGRAGSTGLALQGYTYTGTSSTTVTFRATFSYVFSSPQVGFGMCGTIGAVYLPGLTAVDLARLLSCGLPDFSLADRGSSILASNLHFPGDITQSRQSPPVKSRSRILFGFGNPPNFQGDNYANLDWGFFTGPVGAGMGGGRE